MIGSERFAPGEMLTLIQNSKPVNLLPGDLDVVLYLVIIFRNIPVDDEQRITVKNGVLNLARVLDPEGKIHRLSIKDFKGDLVFLALPRNNSWEFIRSDLTEKELLLLEHTFDKVRTCMDSIDKFINEYPPIGIT